MSALAMGAATRAPAQVDVAELTAKEIAEGYAAGSFTAVQVTQAFLDRIAVYESNYNAFVSFNPDALATAAALDEELLTRGSRGPLHGVPIVIKESMDVAGLPSTAGYRGFSSQAGGVDLIPQLDAPVVTRLKDAGAIILGKTNIPDFSADDTRAYSSWAGWTFNAYNRAIAPGASSSGTATAVAASFAVLGMAEETGGSIQNPASAQGLIGIKTTFGLVPTTGVTPIAASTRDVLGPHAKTYLGDANVDGTFSSGDLLAVLQAGEYEDTIRRNSVWSEGDWDGDREATSRDIILAFQDGGYEQEPQATTTAVPEPSSQLLLLLAAACLLLVRIYTGRTQQALLPMTPLLPDQNVSKELTASDTRERVPSVVSIHFNDRSARSATG